ERPAPAAEPEVKSPAKAPEATLAEEAGAGKAEEVHAFSAEDVADAEEAASASDAYTDADAREEQIEQDNDTVDTLVDETQEVSEAEKVRNYLTGGSRSSGTAKPAADAKPKFDLSKVSKPGDALKAILERKQAEAAAKAAPPPRPTAVAAHAPSAPAAAAPSR